MASSLDIGPVALVNSTLIVTTILSAPYTMLSDDRSGGRRNDRFVGYIPDVIRHVADIVGFEYELRLVADGKYGTKEKNHHWSGMIGEITRWEADMAAGDLKITSMRTRVVDFSPPLMTTHLVMLLQPSDKVANINTFADLGRQTSIRYGTVNDGATKDFFRTSQIFMYKDMWSTMSQTDPSVFVESVEEGVSRARNSKGEYVFITDSLTAEYWTRRSPCGLEMRGKAGPEVGYGLAFPIGSPYHDRVSLATLELHESGKLQQLHERWWDEGACSAASHLVDAATGQRLGITLSLAALASAMLAVVV